MVTGGKWKRRVWGVLLSLFAACATETIGDTQTPLERQTPIVDTQHDEPTENRAQTWSHSTLQLAGQGSIQTRSVMLLIPSGEPPEGGWPYLLVMDGDSAFGVFNIENTLKELVETEELMPWVVVAVQAIERRHEMTLPGVRVFGDYVMEYVLPHIAEQIPLANEGAILGYSYGGLAAVHLALSYPRRLVRVIAMSPSLWANDRAVLRQAARASWLPAKWWLDVGTLEGGPHAVMPYMVADVRQLRADLEQHTQAGLNVVHFEDPGRNHGFAEAGRRMKHALRYALSDAEVDCQITSLELVIMNPRLPAHGSATSLLGRCADGSPRSLMPRQVQFTARGTGARISRGGILSGRHGRIELDALVRGTTVSAMANAVRRR